ncbi:MAG: class F sortase [Nocardioides sp.]|nr:class F sortase [Nocardioides sp.]
MRARWWIALLAVVGSLLVPVAPAQARPVGLASSVDLAQSTELAQSVDLVQARRRARLVIPKLGVNAGIIPVGVRNGELAVGTSVRDVYRWRYGVFPGRPGSAVLAGHTWAAGDGVFDNLHRLRRGNRVRVGTARFRVTRVYKVRSLSRKQVRELFTDQGRPRLVLITCGDRDSAGVYHSRWIVRARKIPS